MSEAFKILPNLPGLSEQESRDAGRISNLQEASIVRILAEPTHAALIGDETGFGKAQPLDALVLTPAGYIRMGDVTVGQEVVIPDGGTALVSGIFPQGIRDVYELTLLDGRTVRADGEHLWSVKNRNDRFLGKPARHLTTLQLIETLRRTDGSSDWAIDTIVPPDLGGEWGSTIDPYFLGLLLGDGGLTQGLPYMSSADEEILEHIRSVLPDGITLKHASNYDYRISGTRPHANAVTVELRRLGLMGKDSWTKFIPSHLLNASAADRLALLQGLLDTDGNARDAGFEFTTASPGLAADVAWLVRSLGGRCVIAQKLVDGKTFQRLTGRLPETIEPFRLTRKIAKRKHATKYPVRALEIRSIEFVGQEEVQCIRVDHPTHEYVTDNFIRTHNTLQAAELLVRAGWERTLFIGVGATYPQWAERLDLQSDGAIQLRKLDSTNAGREAFEDFLAGKPGAWFATIQWLTAQDVQYPIVKDFQGRGIQKVDKKTGQPVFRDRIEPAWKTKTIIVQRKTKTTPRITAEVEVAARAGMIGPASEPVFETKRIRLNTFTKMGNRKAGMLDAIIFDEADAVANRDSQGRKTLLTLKTDWKIAMSATWSGNVFSHAWSLPRWCWPDLIPAYWTWHEIWCRTETTYIAGGRPVDVVVGEKEPEGSFVRTLPCYLRREHEMKAPEPIIVHCDATPEQRSQFEDLKAELMTWVHSEMSQGHEPLVVDIPAVLRTRLRQVALAELSLDAEGGVTFAPDAASAKLRALRGVLDNWGEQPVVIFTDSKIYAKLVAERMTAGGYAARAWTGDSSDAQRQELKRAFMAGEFRYLVLTVQSGGTGLDGLQRVCSKIVWLSLPDGNPKLKEQARGRVFRPGMTTQYGAFEHVLIQMRDSVDVEVFDHLIAKGKAIHASIGAAALAA